MVVPNDRRNGNGERLLRLALLLAAVISVPMTAQGSNFVLSSYPVPLDTDGTRLRSSLYLQLEVKDYGIAPEKLATQTPDVRESALVKALQAIRANDLTALSSLWGPARAAKEGPATEAKGTDLKKMVDLFHLIYGDMSHITIVNQALAGAKSVFVIEMADTSKRSRRMGFEITAGPDGKPYVDSVTSQTTPIENLFVATMVASAGDPSAYKPQTNLVLKHRFAFPLEGKGNPGPHPVVLQFSGDALNFKVVDKQQGAPSPVLAFYRQAYTAVSGRDAKAFIALHTQGSQRDLKNWVAGLNEAQMARFYQRYGEDRYVKFVLNADPFYIIFFSSDPSDEWTVDLLDYEYVYKDPASGAFLLTNTTYEGYLEDILKNPGLFNPLVLRRAKEGTVQKPPAVTK